MSFSGSFLSAHIIAPFLVTSSRIVHWQKGEPHLCPLCHQMVSPEYVGNNRILRTLTGLQRI